MSTAPRSQGPQHNAAHEPPPAQPKRILIVDDEEGLRALCATFLQRRGYTVETSSDGADAWNKLTSATVPYDLLITDNEMPLLDGARLIERVRAAQLPMRILTISGSRAKEGLLPIGHGIDGSLPKPFTIHDLGKAVRAQLEQ